MPRSELLLGMCYLSQSICELAPIRGHASLRKVIGNQKLAKHGTPVSTSTTILSRQKWHTPPDQTLKNSFFTLTSPSTLGQHYRHLNSGALN